MQRGFSTLEILIALGILVITFAAVVIVSFGGQSLLIGGQTDAEAMNEGRHALEEQQALAREDFNLVNSTTTVDGIYTIAVTAQERPDLLSKLVTVAVTWDDEHQQQRSLTLTSLVANFNEAVGGDTCSSVLQGNWASPHIVFQQTLDSLIGTTTAYALSDVDAYKGRLYVTAAKTPFANAPSLFIFDISDPANPSYLGSVDNAPSTSDGLAAVRVAENLSTTPQKMYAFAASDHAANFSTCSQSPSCAQLQAIDVTDPAFAFVAANLKMSGVTSASGGFGNDIFYHNGSIFLGLSSTGGHGSEFHIIDVHNPLAPQESGSWPATSMRHDINAIQVRDGIAYLAHPAGGTYNEQVDALNIANPASPVSAGMFYAAGGIGGNGKSLFVLGDTVYLGRTASNLSGSADAVPEWYALSSDQGVIESVPFATFTLPNSGDSVNATIVRGPYAFLATNSKLLIANATSSVQVASLALPGTGSSAHEPSMDCENNSLYILTNNGSDNGELSVVTAS